MPAPAIAAIAVAATPWALSPATQVQSLAQFVVLCCDALLPGEGGADLLFLKASKDVRRTMRRQRKLFASMDVERDSGREFRGEGGGGGGGVARSYGICRCLLSALVLALSLISLSLHAHTQTVQAIFGEGGEGLGLQGENRAAVKALVKRASAKRSLDLDAWNLSVLERMKEEVMMERDEEVVGEGKEGNKGESDGGDKSDEIDGDGDGDDGNDGDGQRDIQNYQRKICLGQDSAKDSKKKTKTRRRDLAICAALVDKIPNLAGICR